MKDGSHRAPASKGIEEYVDIEQLERIQDACSRALGVALVISDYRGTPITKMSGFTHHCALGRQSPEFAAMCERCDAFGGIRAATGGKPCVYRCHAGLVDFAVPLVVDGNYLGAVLGGQVKLADAPEGAVQDVMPGTTSVTSSTELLAARDEITSVEYERLLAAAETVRYLMSYVLEDGIDSPERMGQMIKDRDAELVSLRAALGELQRAKQKREDQNRRLEEVFRCFFPVMNEMHGLADEEGASATDALLLDFVDVTRYIMETNCAIVSLGEEVDHIRTLLRVLSVRYPGLISYEVRVPERLNPVACPFMVLRPIVLAAVQDPWGAAPDGGCDLAVSVREGDTHLTVRVAQSVVAAEDMRALVDHGGEASSFTMHDASGRLMDMEEGNPGLVVEERTDGQPGCVVSFSLPLARRE